MRLKSIELAGFKSFAKKTQLQFATAVTAVVGPNGSGKSNVAESFRFVLGEQSMKSMRGRRGEDLIWNGSSSSPRAGRASVKLVFDNSDRALPAQAGLNLDFDEVELERVVHRGGQNEYLINGSAVRLRDINELLSQANIGSSGHHIISQGEADRVLSASSRERREMLEDALGLTAYLYKREEAERKLAKTAENTAQVESLRRELSPHLKFLATQVKKIEQAQALKEQLAGEYAEYFKRESVYVAAERAVIEAEREAPEREHKNLSVRIEHLRASVGKKKGDEGARELIELEGRGREVAKKLAEVLRELGSVEGETRAHERTGLSDELIPASDARAFGQRVADELDALASEEGDTLKNKLKALVVLAQEFLHRLAERGGPSVDIEDLRRKKAALERTLGDLQKEEESTARALAALRQKIEGEKDASRESERELFAAMARRSELEAALAQVRNHAEALAREEAEFKADLGEAGSLVGREALAYEHLPLEVLDEDRARQVERRRKLERARIRLEESGTAGASDVLKEHREVSEREAFLARELEDLRASAESLAKLIADLTETLQSRFAEGIDKINTQFDAFFKLMFGGGEARLMVVKEKKFRKGSILGSPELRSNLEDNEDSEDEELEVEEGVEISVALPHKRIKGLHMLSGGERALTSIALIFAMSQVNPPPFLILDETDAALDEANSRRYGDMLENLARKSQLIVITHNRETMSRAGVLYGITMGQDGVSKLLTVKFEEALAVAK